MNKLLLNCLAWFVFFQFVFLLQANSQTTIFTIGTATTVDNNTGNTPFGTLYEDNKNQILFLASELQALGMGPGNIYSVAFSVSTPVSQVMNGFEVRIKNTTTSVMTGFETGLTNVFSGTHTATAGWNILTFSTPFYWDGASNLLIQTCFNNSAWTSNSSVFYTATSFNSNGSGWCDSCVPDPCDSMSNMNNTTVRPNVQIEITQGPLAQADVGVIAIDAPSSGCGLSTNEDIIIRVVNFGTDTQSVIPVVYQINSNPSVIDTIFSIILPNDTIVYTFTTTADFSIVGFYNVESWTTLSSDTINLNDTLKGYLVEIFPVFSTFPFIEDIESEPICAVTCGSSCLLIGDWSNATNDDIDWTVDEGGTPSFNTGPFVDHTTGTNSGNYIYTEASGCNLSTAILLSPCIDISSLGLPFLDFWYHMFGGNMGNLYIDVFSGGIWTTVDSIIGQQQTVQTDPWLKKQINLSAFSGGITIRFRAVTGPGFSSDIAIDDIVVFDVNSPPVSDFTADNTFSCNGSINFSDFSLFPDTWLWDFGDGNSDSIQNPTHVYASPGTYTVTLITTNIFGSDTLIKFNYITISTGPLPVSCTPITTSYCCGIGIYNVTFNTINNTTADGIEGYQDYSCASATDVIIDQSYTISIQTGTSWQENVRVWIDYNNDGFFDDDPATELVFWSDSILTNHSGAVTISLSAVINTSLRMRVGSDYYTNPTPQPCVDVIRGQFEDYTITVLPNTVPPVADIYINVLDTCQGIVSFTDQSIYNPTNWLWDFGDGSGLSTSQNPFYAYNLPGIYTVTLIVTNPYGSDTITQQVVINLIKADFTISADTVVVGEVVNFVDNSIGADIWDWNFGDSFSSSNQNTFHAYFSTDTFMVVLVVTNLSSGCMAQKLQQIVVIECTVKPQTGSITGPANVNTSATTNYSVTFHNGSTYNWTIVGGNQTSGGLTNFITVQWGSPGSGQITVVETDSIGCTGDPVSLVVIIGSTDINYLQVTSLKFEVYPNPSRGVFVLTINNPPAERAGLRFKNGELTIYNMLGSIILKSKIANRISEIDISGHPSGIYHLQITTDRGTAHRKIVIE